MSLPDKYLSRWLDQDPNQGVPGIPPMGLSTGDGLGNTNGPDGDGDSVEAAEVQALWRRFQLVQGLLSTLDSRVAPEELDRRVEALLVDGPGDVSESGSDHFPEGPEWDSILEGLAEEPVDSLPVDSLPVDSLQAPEFLDRIVEGRLQAIEEQLGEVRGRQNRMRWVRRGSLALSAALVLMLVPWGNLGQDRQTAPLPLVQYTSLEGMQSAFPDQMRFVSESGEFGAVLSAPSEETKGGQASKPERVR